MPDNSGPLSVPRQPDAIQNSYVLHSNTSYIIKMPNSAVCLVSRTTLCPIEVCQNQSANNQSVNQLASQSISQSVIQSINQSWVMIWCHAIQCEVRWLMWHNVILCDMGSQTWCDEMPHDNMQTVLTTYRAQYQISIRYSAIVMGNIQVCIARPQLNLISWI